MIDWEKTNNRLDKIDGRTIFFLTVCSCFITFLSTSMLNHALYTIWLLLILCFFGFLKQSLYFSSFYLLSLIGLIIETNHNISFPSPLLLSMIYKLILPAMSAYLLIKIPSGKLTASLRKIPIPNKFMLVLIVMLRFAPTIIYEFGEVKEAMKIRGFLKSFTNIFSHPLNTLEYAIVPMVFRSLTISDELAASAIVRGIESPYNKDSYYISIITYIDIILLLISTLLAVYCCFF
ncbi:energy-coupling factor transporter transmembrane component T family protein [Anaerovorax odorimutans]|uniref:energy-coupling factor transporter transmembrane component T family protein n=1 Tax=Anaerovorax odorimutans TaxID=109327 RepID=UPI00040572D2|nr:energy-coupling factor transporter transmembrane component T [Anaerovorax odorimutans]